MEEWIDARGAGQERIIEILVFLLDEMRHNKQITEIDLTALSARGFSQTEISTAFSWLFDKIAIAGPDSQLKASINADASQNYRQRSTSFRIYHESERAVLSKQVQGYLLQLRELGLLSDSEMELLVDRVIMSGIPYIEMSDMKSLVAGVVFDFDDSTRYGSRLMLNSNDTIQ